jgi:tRNA G46 methylase TrmB
MDKPHAPACDRNREPILAVLRDCFAGRSRVLEIGSGTGQHAVHFAAALPHLTWQCTERDGTWPGSGCGSTRRRCRTRRRRSRST